MPLNPAGYTAASRAAASVMTEGDEEKRHRSGIIGDLFNLLGRTSGASAQAAYNITDVDDNTTALQGLLQGIQGKSNVSYKNVLQDNLGVTNPVVSSVAGFAGDVALDPLTYVGVKKVKGVGEADAIIQAIKSGSDDVALTASEIMAKNPTRVGLTVAGKPIGSVKADIGSKAVEKLLGPVENRGTLARAFSREAELPLGMNNMSRVIESSHAAQFHDFRNGLKGLFDGVSAPDREAISLALDTGQTLRTPVSNPGKTKFGTLQEYVDASRKIMDDMMIDEGNMGLFTLKKGATGKAASDFEEYNDKYVYRFFNKPPADIIPGVPSLIKTKAVGSDTSDFMMKRKKNVSLSEAKDLGYDPVTDIVDILDMRAAKHFRTTGRAAFVRDAVEQFGISAEELAKIPKGELKDLGWRKATDVTSPVTKNMGDKYLPEFAVRALNQAEAVFKDPSTGNAAVRLHDKVMGYWKFANTAAMPGYHIRNSLGDTLLNMADGVTNPTRYGQAMKVVMDRKKINERLLLQQAGLAEDAIPTGTQSIRVGGKKLSTDEVWQLYGLGGGKSGMITSEIQRSMSDLEKVTMRNAASLTKTKIGDFADAREDIFRLAHFIDRMNKTVGKRGYKGSLEDAALEAGKAVRKYNIDYGNLSSFEQNVAKRIIPFYSWMRRATPLNIELMFTKPGFMALYPKGQDLMQGLLGTDNAEGEQLIPQWIRDMAPVRVALGKQEERNALQNVLAGLVGAGDNEAAFLSTTTGMTPFDTLQMPGDLAKAALQGDVAGVGRAATAPLTNGLTPLLKAPIELNTGRSMYTGQEITDHGAWLASLLGPSRVAYKAGMEGNRTPLVGALTGLPIQVATGARQEGEFMRRQDIQQSQNREEKLSTLRNRIPDFDSLPEAKREKLMSGVKAKQDPEVKRQRRYLTQILGQ